MLSVFVPPRGWRKDWSFWQGDLENFLAEPVLVGGKIYAAGAWVGHSHDENRGGVVCFDASTGQLAWMFAPRGTRGIRSLSVGEGYVVVGEGLGGSCDGVAPKAWKEDGRIFCLDAQESEKERKGVLLWEFRTAGTVEWAPCIADGRAYVAAGLDGLYCLALEPGADGRATIVWHLAGKRYPNCASPPVLHDGKVYFGLGMEGQAVCCIDARTGQEEWRIETPCPVMGTPTIREGRLFVGMGYGDWGIDPVIVKDVKLREMQRQGAQPEQLAVVSRQIRKVGEVWNIDIARREVAWRYALPDAVPGALIVDGARLYLGCRDGYLYSLGTDGTLVAKWQASNSIRSSPSVDGQNVYVVVRDTVHVLDKRDLSLRDTCRLPAEGYSLLSAGGRVFVGTERGIMCLQRVSSANDAG